jgi:hypothetical protein
MKQVLTLIISCTSLMLHSRSAEAVECPLDYHWEQGRDAKVLLLGKQIQIDGSSYPIYNFTEACEGKEEYVAYKAFRNRYLGYLSAASLGLGGGAGYFLGDQLFGGETVTGDEGCTECVMMGFGSAVGVYVGGTLLLKRFYSQSPFSVSIREQLDVIQDVATSERGDAGRFLSGCLRQNQRSKQNCSDYLGLAQNGKPWMDEYEQKIPEAVRSYAILQSIDMQVTANACFDTDVRNRPAIEGDGTDPLRTALARCNLFASQFSEWEGFLSQHELVGDEIDEAMEKFEEAKAQLQKVNKHKRLIVNRIKFEQKLSFCSNQLDILNEDWPNPTEMRSVFEQLDAQEEALYHAKRRARKYRKKFVPPEQSEDLLPQNLSVEIKTYGDAIGALDTLFDGWGKVQVTCNVALKTWKKNWATDKERRDIIILNNNVEAFYNSYGDLKTEFSTAEKRESEEVQQLKPIFRPPNTKQCQIWENAASMDTAKEQNCLSNEYFIYPWDCKSTNGAVRHRWSFRNPTNETQECMEHPTWTSREHFPTCRMISEECKGK